MFKTKSLKHKSRKRGLIIHNGLKVWTLTRFLRPPSPSVHNSYFCNEEVPHVSDVPLYSIYCLNQGFFVDKKNSVCYKTKRFETYVFSLDTSNKFTSEEPGRDLKGEIMIGHTNLLHLVSPETVFRGTQV